MFQVPKRLMSPARQRKIEQIERAVATKEVREKTPENGTDTGRKQRSPAPKLVPEVDGVASTARLNSFLDNKGPRGIVMRRILDGTQNYRPEREMTRTAKVFETAELPYELFRKALHNLYQLNFTDDEFSHVKQIFDEHGQGYINGYQFMVAFVQLGSIRKEKEAADMRRKEQEATKRREHEEEMKRLEAEKKMAVAADYTFTGNSPTFHTLLCPLIHPFYHPFSLSSNRGSASACSGQARGRCQVIRSLPPLRPRPRQLCRVRLQRWRAARAAAVSGMFSLSHILSMFSNIP